MDRSTDPADPLLVSTDPAATMRPGQREPPETDLRSICDRAAVDCGEAARAAVRRPVHLLSAKSE
jgi:hypothetical protein